MRTRLTEDIKRRVRPALYSAAHPRKRRFRCPVCGYAGPFKDKTLSRAPRLVRLDTKCPRCGSVERERFAWLVLTDLFLEWDPSTRDLLHIAPEFCLQPLLRRAFRSYRSADLHRRDVDVAADIQELPFEDASFDCVYLSRVLKYVPDTEAALRQTRRVLRPGGLAVVSEHYVCETTVDTDLERTGAAHALGADLLERFDAHFDRVERCFSDERPGEHQLLNRFVRDGAPMDDFPDLVRVPGVGSREVLCLCWAGADRENRRANNTG